MSKAKQPESGNSSDTPTIGDEIGAFKALWFDREFTHTAREGDELTQRTVERDAGVYLPKTVVNGGTVVQNNADVLADAAETAAEIAQAIADDGYAVYGFGKSHDNELFVFAEPNEQRESRERISRETDGTPFSKIKVMGMSQGWTKHYERTPTLTWQRD